uniref:Uncharacterized protein n=1 Tax=Plectus sambesii TaxID=2011161 RepID=A0A914W3G5_9BILA
MTHVEAGIRAPVCSQSISGLHNGPSLWCNLGYKNERLQPERHCSLSINATRWISNHRRPSGDNHTEKSPYFVLEAFLSLGYFPGHSDSKTHQEPRRLSSRASGRVEDEGPPVARFGIASYSNSVPKWRDRQKNTHQNN